MVSLAVVLIACSDDELQSVQAELAATSAELEQAHDALAGARLDVEAISVERDRLVDESATLTSERDSLNMEYSEENAELSQRIDELEREVSDAERDLAANGTAVAQLETLVASLEADMATLRLAFDDEILAARATFTTLAEGHACEYGESAFASGTPLGGLSGDGALDAYVRTDAFFDLRSDDPGVAAVLELVVNPRDALTVSVTTLLPLARACWQELDAQENADLYVALPRLRAAYLEAACLYGDIAGWGRSTDATDTLTFVDGGIEDDYVDRVEASYGSLDEFVDVESLASEMAQESARCEGERNLNGPIGSGTYEVGVDIQPGIWVTHDVEDCYWERTRSDGRILDNDFVTVASRIPVTVRSSDTFFSAERCGRWYYANP